VDARPAIIDEATTLLDDVDRALARLAEGTYRSCEVCAAPLNDEVLSGEPTRRRCDEHRGTVAE
jgi:RNA polymerase-binding transcription factor DksA